MSTTKNDNVNDEEEYRRTDPYRFQEVTVITSHEIEGPTIREL